MKCGGCGDDVCEKCGICHAGMTDAKGDDCIDMLKAALERDKRSIHDLRLKYLAGRDLLAKEMGFKGASLEGGKTRAYERIVALAESQEFVNEVERMDEEMMRDWGAKK